MIKLLLIILLSGHIAVAESIVGMAPVRRISVRAESRIGNQKLVHLEDIAEFSGFDWQSLSNVKSLEIIDTPIIGDKRRFTNIGFAQILRAKLNSFEDANRIVLNIPSEVLISRKSAKLETTEIESELMSRLKKQCLNCDYEITNLILPIINQDLSNGSSWRIKIENQAPKGSFSIPLEVSNDDGTRRLYWLAGNIRVHQLVPVAKHNINSGENVKDDDFYFDKREITYVNDNIASADELKVAVAGRNILANQIIGASSIHKPSVVRIGETVKVFIGEDGWQVSLDGVAQQNAFKGDLVKVKILRSQKIISGIATEKGMVEIR